jgi:hypothetical protein
MRSRAVNKNKGNVVYETKVSNLANHCRSQAGFKAHPEILICTEVKPEIRKYSFKLNQKQDLIDALVVEGANLVRNEYWK